MMQATVGTVRRDHLGLRAGDRAALSVLLGGDARVRARRVDERDERELEPLGDLHDPHRLVVALGIRHPELAVEPLLDVASLLVADERDRAAVDLAETGDERAVVRAAAVAVELDPVVDEPLDVVERVRPLGMARELDRAPDRLVARVLLQALELLLEPLRLAVDARTPRSKGSRDRPLRRCRRFTSWSRLAHLKSLRTRARYARCCGRGTIASM